MRLKAQNFLGVCSVRHGCIVSCLTQILIGVLIWSSLGYLRPMLEVFSITLLVYFMSGAILGLYGILTRNEVITWLYLIQLGSGAALTLMIAVDYAGIYHILPKPSMSPTTPVIPPFILKAREWEDSLSSRVSNMIPTLSSSSNSSHPITNTVFLQNLSDI